jgi:hypothetical protein
LQKIKDITFEPTKFKDTYKAVATTDLGYEISPEYYLRKGAEKHFLEKFNRDLMPRVERMTDKFFAEKLKSIIN